MAKGRKVRISNSALNQHGTRILTEGVELEQYKKNPVLLYMHERGQVIGYMQNVEMQGDETLTQKWVEGMLSSLWVKGYIRCNTVVGAGVRYFELEPFGIEYLKALEGGEQ